jgi:hypothetical protein
MCLKPSEQFNGIHLIHLGKDLLHEGWLHILEDELDLAFFRHGRIYFRA